MNQQEVINLIKTISFDHIKIAQHNNGIIDIQILPLKPTSTNLVNEMLARRSQRKAMSTEELQKIREVR